jgi:hypothetical protein
MSVKSIRVNFHLSSFFFGLLQGQIVAAVSFAYALSIVVIITEEVL